MCYSVPMLKVEEWPLPGESLTGDTVRALIDRVSHIYWNSVAPQIHKYTRELNFNVSLVQWFPTQGGQLLPPRGSKDKSEGYQMIDLSIKKIIYIPSFLKASIYTF